MLMWSPISAADRADGTIKKTVAPDPSFSLRAPNNSKWTIRYAAPGRDANPTASSSGQRLPDCVQWTVTKSGDTYHEEKSRADGSHTDSWRVGKMQIVLSADPKKIQIYEPSSFSTSEDGEIRASPAVYTDFSRTDFPGLEWVSADKFVGILEKSGGNYNVFREPSPDSMSRATAIFDAQTLMPVRLETPAFVAVYAFDPGHREKLVLPEELLRLFERRRQVLQTLTTTSPSY